MGQCASTISGSDRGLVTHYRRRLAQHSITDDDIRDSYARTAAVCDTRRLTWYESWLLRGVLYHIDATRGDDVCTRLREDAGRHEQNRPLLKKAE